MLGNHLVFLGTTSNGLMVRWVVSRTMAIVNCAEKIGCCLCRSAKLWHKPSESETIGHGP